MAGTIVILCIALPYMVPILMVIIYIFKKVRGYYLVSSREIRRYDATTRSPVYAMLSSNIKVATIMLQDKNDACGFLS